MTNLKFDIGSESEELSDGLLLDCQPNLRQSGSWLDLVTLPPEDVVYKEIFPQLSLKDLFNLRDADLVKYGPLVDNYLPTITNIDQFGQSEFLNADISERHLKLFSEKCVNLRVVNLRNTLLNGYQVKTLLEGKTNITYLDLSYTQLDPSCLHPILINCKNLKTLKLRKCHWLTAGCLQAIVLNLSNLEEVDVTDCHQLDKNRLSPCLTMMSKCYFPQMDAHKEQKKAQLILPVAKGLAGCAHLVSGCECSFLK